MKRTRIRRFSKRRGGLSRNQRLELKELCRTVVMTKHGAFLFTEGAKRSWRGECSICSNTHWLQVCHIFSVGKYPRAEFMPANTFAACWRCHLGPGGWHKDPTWAKDWIMDRLGVYCYDLLKTKVETAGPVDYTLTRAWLLAEIAKLSA